MSKASAKIGFLHRLSPQLDSLTLRELYTKCIRPFLEYGSIVWSGLQTTDANLLEKCNRRAARLILKFRTSTSRDLPPDLLLARAGISRLEPRRKLEQVTFCIRILCKKLPTHLQESTSRWIPTIVTYEKPLRQPTVRLPLPKANVLRNSPFYLYTAFSTWNSRPIELQALAQEVLSLYFLS